MHMSTTILFFGEEEEDFFRGLTATMYRGRMMRSSFSMTDDRRGHFVAGLLGGRWGGGGLFHPHTLSP